jgi:nucleolar protein 15
MFGHILKCQTVPSEQIHENLWKGANKRFKKVPWNRMEGRKLNKAQPRSEWEKRIEKESRRRASRQVKLKAMGYDFEMPKLKRVEDVPVRNKTKLIAGTAKEDGGAEGAATTICTP